jgi:hypothetical protein
MKNHIIQPTINIEQFPKLRITDGKRVTVMWISGVFPDWQVMTNNRATAPYLVM